MPAQTRSQTKLYDNTNNNVIIDDVIIDDVIIDDVNQKIVLPKEKQINMDEYMKLKRNSYNLQKMIYKKSNKILGVKYLTLTQIIENKVKGYVETPKGEMLHTTIDLKDVDPKYYNSKKVKLPKANEKDIRAIAPEGLFWKEDTRETSYFSWGEWYRLYQLPEDIITH